MSYSLRCTGCFKNRISDADVAFISDYKSYIRSGNVQGVSRMSQEHASANYNVDHSILDYFTPGWNDEFVKLPIRPQVRICDGRFMISRAFQIMDENDAVIRNAEIRFERGGYLYIIRDKPSEIQIENCIFVASERSKTSRHDTADPFVSSGTYPKVRFKNCIFSGAEAMWAIHSSSAVIFEDCEFKNMGIRGKGDICSPMITANSLVCKNCVFENCASANEVLFEAVDYVLEGCKFSRCHTNNSIFAWNGGAHKFEIRETLFEDCSTTWPIVKSFNSYKLAQDYGFYECKFDRFSHNGWCNKEEVDSKMHKGCTEIS